MCVSSFSENFGKLKYAVSSGGHFIALVLVIQSGINGPHLHSENSVFSETSSEAGPHYCAAEMFQSQLQYPTVRTGCS